MIFFILLNRNEERKDLKIINQRSNGAKSTESTKNSSKEDHGVTKFRVDEIIKPRVLVQHNLFCVRVLQKKKARKNKHQENSN